MSKILYSLPLLILLLAACNSSQKNTDTTDSAAFKSITELGFSSYVKDLAADSFEGRKPFTNGEKKTIAYIKNAFEEIGLTPGNGESFFQKVPMVEIKSTPNSILSFNGAKGKIDFKLLEEAVLGSRRVQPSIDVKTSEVVFAGFGIVAPEFKWNDYAGLDVKGKTVIVMVNDPGYYNKDLFKGSNMTYYGRWTYKFEEAARQGATGVLIIHDTGAASYGWHVVRSGWSGPQLNLQTADNGASRAAFEGWLNADAAKRLFEFAGVSPDLIEEAKKPGFKAVDLKINTGVAIKQEVKKSTSNNVIAKIAGSQRPEECIIYSAHWDHLGIGEAIKGDSIYNGAVDNATGVAGLLEIAKAFKNAKRTPERSILFIALTGEEEGLLGSEYYATHPIYPLAKTVANLNMDAMAPIAKTKDVTIVGLGQSEMDDYADRAAKKQHRVILAPADATNGWFYRSDHFNFAKVGVPALYPATGDDVIGKGKDFGLAQKADYNKTRYHQPGDQYDDSWKLDGIIADLQLLFDVGYTLSMETTFPKWKEGSEFKAVGEKR
ncbi:M28 family metallopeptidase [Olivibacter domesticus]|uniref:Zn-dependent amino-or carboxypeptidase, M28 family n=1 Tax=Olivibacter domesticus TaxID=407022 RepID=A0A1H7VG61_OLID1|nr:M28 family metallopeptidase [Olivibacter domesticus]SEM07895.1 Zn-dependent amino-or carboxypeptidase, M28 family [Olivibacter domesticus]